MRRALRSPPAATSLGGISGRQQERARGLSRAAEKVWRKAQCRTPSMHRRHSARGSALQVQASESKVVVVGEERGWQEPLLPLPLEGPTLCWNVSRDCQSPTQPAPTRQTLSCSPAMPPQPPQTSQPVLPRDARLIALILAAAGAEDCEEGVVRMLVEFAHRESACFRFISSRDGLEGMALWRVENGSGSRGADTLLFHRLHKRRPDRLAALRRARPRRVNFDRAGRSFR